MEPSYHPDVQLDNWTPINRYGFKSSIDYAFVYRDTKVTQSVCDLFPHQRFVKDFLQPDSPYRGLLLYHQVGTGKSRSAIAIAEQYPTSKKVYVLLPASLRSNYIAELKTCQSHYYHDREQKWGFTKTDTEDLCTSMNITPKYAETHGIYMPNEHGLHTINSHPAITSQLDHMRENRYVFIHYNSSSKKDFNALKAARTSANASIFDDGIVIIDEIHNLVSSITNAGEGFTLCVEFYKHLLNARNVKIIALSGTPLINKPIELAFLFNIIHGKIKVHRLPCKPTVSNTLFLESRQDIDSFRYHDGGFEIILREQQALDTIMTQLKCNEDSYKDVNQTLFPTDEKFDDLFVDYTTNCIKNKNMMTRRLSGLLSFYEASQSNSDYPEFDKMVIDRVEMSDFQLNVYQAERKLEIESERKKKKINKSGDEPTGSYRSYSRMASNFAFPIDIPRPKKKYNREDSIKENVREIKESIVSLESSTEQYLSLDKLHHYSPKFVKIINRVNECNAPCLIYSSFRSLEGVALLKSCLEKNGYHHLTCVKNAQRELELVVPRVYKPSFIIFTDDKEKNNLLIDVFNSNIKNLSVNVLKQLAEWPRQPYTSFNPHDCNIRGHFVKVIMITQSGAEGISLKCVRQVHMLEPHWNNVRIHQVIGRAIRAKSHNALPVSERKVKAFLYVSVYSKTQVSNEITTDETIHNIALRKQVLLDSFLKVIKESAVDAKRGEPFGKRLGTMYSSFDINEDPLDAAYKTSEVVHEFGVIVQPYMGRQIVFDKKTLKVYFADDKLKHEAVGRLEKNEGRMRMVINETNE